MRFLISGFGSIGRRHFRNLVSLGERDIVLHRVGKTTLPIDEIKDIPVLADIHQALDTWNPDAAIVANPSALHLDIAIPAARQGCTVFVEKPLSHSDNRLAELRQALEEGGVSLSLGFQFRFHPTLQIAADLLHEQRIGVPYAAHVHWGEFLPSWHPWEDYRESYSAREDLGGGVVNTLCHPFDYLRWLLGEVREVRGRTASMRSLDTDVEDMALIGLIFENGCHASIHLDYLQQPSEHTISIYGSKGTLHWDNETAELKVWTTDSSTWDVYPPPEGFERNDLFLAEMRHFIEVVNGGTSPKSGLEDGVAALEIAMAVHQSHFENEPIKLARN
jgi:predicted dehydrogenase